MGPKTIVGTALERGLDIIALTDHNSALNTPAVEKLCEDSGLGFLAGMEVTTREDAHVLCLFPDSATALEFGELIHSRQPVIPNNRRLMGDQIHVDSDEVVLGEVEYCLSVATSIEWSELGVLVHEFGGLWIPAHIDRQYSGVITMLGFLPEENYDGLELVKLPYSGQTWGKKLIQDSDAHAPEDIARRYWKAEAYGVSAFDRVKNSLCTRV